MATAESTPTRTQPRITTVAGRKSLTPRRDPYFEPIAGNQGASLGFRKLGDVGTEQGTWIVRVRHDRDGSSAYKFESLGALADHNAATKEAQKWLDLFRKGFTDTDMSVRKLCADFADAVEKSWMGSKPPRPKTAQELRSRFTVWVDEQPLGRIKLTDLTRAHLRDWRKTVEETQDIHGKKRTPSSINRTMVGLRAALNWALKERELIATDAAWAVPLRKIAKADKSRNIYLTMEQRMALRDACPTDLQPLVSAMIALPARPSALSVLRVRDFQKATGMLTIPKDKTASASGRSLKLPKKTAELFANQCKDKKPDALIFPREDGSEWKAGEWGTAIREAREQAFPEGSDARRATMYVYRHCSITDLLHGSVSVSQVAQWAGTSIAEIDKHYAQHIPAHAEKGLALLEAGLQ